MTRTHTLPHSVALIITDINRKYFQTESTYATEKHARKEAKNIEKYLRRLNIQSSILAANKDLPKKLFELQPDAALNLVGTVRGIDHLAATIPALLELMEIPYSGSGPIAESGGYNKYMIKKQLQSADILTPNCQLFYTPYDKLSASISFPVIVKLNETHGSVDLDEHAICHNSHSLQKRLSYLYKRYQQTMLVEEFIMGDEFSAIVIDSKNKLQTFVAKNIFPNKDPYTFASFNLQWTNEEVGFEKYCDPDLTVLLKKAYRVVGMRDYGKFDLRKDKKGRYYFLDSNTNPAFGPLENDCAISSVLHLYGVSFENLLLKVFQNMMERKIKIK